MKTKSMGWLMVCLIMWSPSAYSIVPPNEAKIIEEVADEYSLNEFQTALLYTIRRVENGGPGREFGVLHPRAINTTFRNQAQWAAGSIKKRCPDASHLEKFAARWCPLDDPRDTTNLNKNWLPNAKYYLKKLEVM